MPRGRKPKAKKEEVKVTVENTCKTREEIFAELNARVEETISAFEMAAKENRELAYRIIAAKKTLERTAKTLH